MSYFFSDFFCGFLHCCSFPLLPAACACLYFAASLFLAFLFLRVFAFPLFFLPCVKGCRAILKPQSKGHEPWFQLDGGTAEGSLQLARHRGASRPVPSSEERSVL